jgi:hypothetical protein
MAPMTERILVMVSLTMACSSEATSQLALAVPNT